MQQLRARPQRLGKLVQMDLTQSMSYYMRGGPLRRALACKTLFACAMVAHAQPIACGFAVLGIVLTSGHFTMPVVFVVSFSSAKAFRSSSFPTAPLHAVQPLVRTMILDQLVINAMRNDMRLISACMSMLICAIQDVAI